MENNFDRAIEFVLKWEGGYTFNPQDPGGETNFGISRKAYPHLDIKNLTREMAIEIYRKDYWDRAGCNSLSNPLDIIVFDTAVNMGWARTLSIGDRSNSWTEFLMERIRFYTTFRAADIFLKGWVNRVLSLYDFVKKPILTEAK